MLTLMALMLAMARQDIDIDIHIAIAVAYKRLRSATPLALLARAILRICHTYVMMLPYATIRALLRDTLMITLR